MNKYSYNISFTQKVISNNLSSNIKVDEYLASAKSIYGADKVKEVCARYHLFQSVKGNKTLKSHHIHQLQVGLNDINANDLDSFLCKIKTDGPFCKREEATLRKIGTNSVNALKSYRTASELPAPLFNTLLSALQEPDPSYRDTTFTTTIDPSTISGIPGERFSKRHLVHGFFSHRLGRSFEDEDRLCLYDELKNLGPEDQSRYCEVLTKIIVKKHLYYEQEDSKELRMGMLIPAPKGKDNEPRWYRVDDMIDSGLGKFAYRLVPATCEYSDDMPDLLLYRNSAPLPTAMDSFTCFLSDFNIFPPGYLSKKSCMAQELNWLKKATPSPGNAHRPLLITGHSLGSSNAQLALLNMQQSGKWPNRKIALELFDSPAILKKDARNFASWINASNLPYPLSINYYVSDGDPVPLGGSIAGSSYLGNYLDPDKYKVAVHKQKLTDKGMKQPALTGQGPHGRICHRGIEGVDFTDTVVSVSEYDEEVLHQRIITNALRILSAAIVWSTVAPLGGLKRFVLGRRHHDPIIVQIFRKNVPLKMDFSSN